MLLENLAPHDVTPAPHPAPGTTVPSGDHRVHATDRRPASASVMSELVEFEWPMRRIDEILNELVEWPLHRFDEILNELVNADLSVSDEQLIRRRLVSALLTSSSTAASTTEGEQGATAAEAVGAGALLINVLRVCLTFAGNKLNGVRIQTACARTARGNRHPYQAPRQALSLRWCDVALQILLNAPEAIALSPDAYYLLLEHFICCRGLGSMMLEAVDCAVEKNNVDGKLLWPFVTLAVISSKNCAGDAVRDAVSRMTTYVRSFAQKDFRALVKKLDARGRGDLLELCVARPGGVLTKTLPVLMAEWPACCGPALSLVVVRLLHGGSFAAWSDVLHLVGTSWRESYGLLSVDEQQSLMTVVQKLPELVSTQALRSVSRVARAVTRIAVVSASCEEAVLEMAQTFITEQGPTPACGMFIAYQLLCDGSHEAHFGEATALLEAGVSHSDDFIKCTAFELVAEIMEKPQVAEITAWSRKVTSAAASIAGSALDAHSRVEPGKETPPLSLAALHGAVRLVFVDMRSRPNKHASLLKALLAAVARVQDFTRVHLQINQCCVWDFKSLLEVMMDEAVQYPRTMTQRLASTSKSTQLALQLIEDVDAPAVKDNLVNFVEAHRWLSVFLDGAGASESRGSTLAPECRMRLQGCAKLLDVARRTSSFTAEHRMHMMDVAVCCLKDVCTSNSFFEDGLQGAVRDCATYAMKAWRAWQASAFSGVGDSFASDAEVPRALELLRECIKVSSTHGDLNNVCELIEQVTAEEDRVAASMDVVKLTESASPNKSRNRARRAARHSPVCGITAIFSHAFHYQAHYTNIDNAADGIAAATLNVMRALVHARCAKASKDAEFVVQASMKVVRKAFLDTHVMNSAHAVNMMQLLVEHQQRADTLPGRVSSLADILSDAASHIAQGFLLNALRVLVTAMEADLEVLSKCNTHATETKALLDASIALQSALEAIQVYSDSGGSMSDSIGMPAFVDLVLKAARHCLDVICNMLSASDELAGVISAGAELARRVEKVMQRGILPEQLSRSLEPWRRLTFFHSARPRQLARGSLDKGDTHYEEVLQTSLASTEDWVDEWPAGPANPRASAHTVEETHEPRKVGMLEELTATASSLGGKRDDTSGAACAPRKRKKRKRNPYVEALRASEGSKGGTAKEYDDLEDFIVCKPGRDYHHRI